MRIAFGLVGVYAVIFGALFGLGYVLEHLDIQSIVVLGLVAMLFGAHFLGFGQAK